MSQVGILWRNFTPAQKQKAVRVMVYLVVKSSHGIATRIMTGVRQEHEKFTALGEVEYTRLRQVAYPALSDETQAVAEFINNTIEIEFNQLARDFSHWLKAADIDDPFAQG
jgi:hypothetical protein